MDSTPLSGIPPEARIEADICIVGTGPAGATLARELAGSRLSVILLESGGERPDPAADALNEIENVGAARTLDQSIIRNRMLGGTSYLWSGRCVALDDIDYRRRPWVTHSGWPIGPETLAPFLQRCAPHLGLGECGHDVNGGGFWSVAGRARPASHLDEALVRPIFWQFSRAGNVAQYVRFGPRLLAEPATNVRLLTGATVVHVNTDQAASRVISVEVAAPDDGRRTVFTRAVVLCAGGIENARLLLASNRVAPAGLGNAHDRVGRFLMDHPRGGVGVFDRGDARALEPHFGTHFVTTGLGTHLFSQGLRLSPAAQEREGLLNCSVWLSELVAADDPWSAVKRIANRRADWRRDAWALAANAGLIARGLHRRLTTGGGMPRKLDGLELNCMVEQHPDPDSRVTLAARTDRHGIPLSRVDWRRHPLEWRTILRTSELAAKALRAVDAPAPAPPAWLTKGAAYPVDFKDVAHHIGTTRMSDNPRAGVVDTNCLVHGVQGLYVAGSSVFPTSGHANPTQTIVMLAIRLADTLKRRGVV